MDNHTYKKLEYITSGSGLNSEELNQIVDLMEEYSNQCVKAGFESFRLKAEEEVKKQITEAGTGYLGQESSALNKALEIIKDIKQ